mmetsp:Transcript_37619/g.47950  ORF Transcript_37619/g.47950 Transcript_37619/m.47950 type:complete len:596 (-) Transcript_37619:394-2181(-)
MVLFGKEERFKSSQQRIVNETIRTCTQTGNDFVGPGYNGTDIFSHWNQKSFSKRQPMTPSKSERLDFGRMLRSECVVEPTPYLEYDAGPGYYCGQVTNHFSQTIHHVGKVPATAESGFEVPYSSPFLRKSHNINAPSPKPYRRRSISDHNGSQGSRQSRRGQAVPITPLVGRSRNDSGFEDGQAQQHASGLGTEILQRQVPDVPWPSATGEELLEAGFVASPASQLPSGSKFRRGNSTSRRRAKRGTSKAQQPQLVWQDKRRTQAQEGRELAVPVSQEGEVEDSLRNHLSSGVLAREASQSAPHEEVASPSSSNLQSSQESTNREIHHSQDNDQPLEANETVPGSTDQQHGHAQQQSSQAKPHPLSGLSQPGHRRAVSADTVQSSAADRAHWSKKAQPSDRTVSLQWHQQGIRAGSPDRASASELLADAFPHDVPPEAPSTQLVAQAFPPKPKALAVVLKPSPQRDGGGQQQRGSGNDHRGVRPRRAAGQDEGSVVSDETDTTPWGGGSSSGRPEPLGWMSPPLSETPHVFSVAHSDEDQDTHDPALGDRHSLPSAQGQGHLLHSKVTVVPYIQQKSLTSMQVRRDEILRQLGKL